MNSSLKAWAAAVVAPFVLAVALHWCPAARAQQSQDDTWCVNKDNQFSADLQTKGCAAAIQSGRWSAKELALTFYNRGTANHAKGDDDRAIADYDQAIRLDPKNAAAFKDRGIAYHLKGDYDRAIADYDQAIRLDPKNAFAFINRGIAYHAKKDYDRAIADYDQTIGLDPKYAVAFKNRGTAYHAKKDEDRAIADYSEAIRLDSKFASTYDSRGGAYTAKGDDDRAIADYTKTIELDPKNGAFLVDRGIAYRVKGDYDRAIADYDQAIRLDRKNADAFVDRAVAYHFKGDYDRAIADYDQAIRLDPKNAFAFKNRGTNYYFKGDYDRAIADYDQTIGLDPKFAAAFKDRGTAYHVKKDYDRAIADYDQAIRLDPKDAVAFLNRGIAYHVKGDYDRAIADYDQAIRLDPKYAAAFKNRGTAYHAKKDEDRAIADYSEAIRLDSKFASTYDSRGDAYKAKGDYDRAIADYTKAIELDPGFTAAYTDRGLAFEAKGEQQRAKTDFNAALAVPQKYDTGKWAHDTARARLAALGVQPSVASPAPSAGNPAVLAPVRAEKRVALLIGNSAYHMEVGGPLASPQNDIALLARTLKGLGFDVTTIKDAGLAALYRALNVYVRRLQEVGPDAVGFFYYSGHGALNEATRTDYLIPVDVDSADIAELWSGSVRLTEITARLKNEAGNATHFVVFDACRNGLKLKKTGKGAQMQSKGFVPVGDESGMLIAFATAEGQLASDDASAGAGAYARMLAEEIVKPGIEAVTMFRRVQLRVRATIGQEPWVGYGALGEVYLAGLTSSEAPKPTPRPSVSAVSPALSEAAEAWAVTQNSTSIAVLEEFARQFGSTPYGSMARARLDELKGIGNPQPAQR